MRIVTLVLAVTLLVGAFGVCGRAVQALVWGMMAFGALALVVDWMEVRQWRG